MQYKNVGIALALSLAFTAPVFAEDASVSTSANTSATVEHKGSEDKNHEQRDRIKAEMEAKKMELKASLDAKKGEIKSAIDDGKKAEFEKAHDEMKSDKDAAKARMKAAIEAKKAAFKLEVKKVKEEKIATRKDFAVQKYTAAAKVIEANQTRVATIIANRKVEGKDTASAEASLQLSKDKLVTARASIAALAKLSATTEADAKALKTAAQKAEDDLKASRDALIKALDGLEIKVETRTQVQAGSTTSATTAATVSAQ